MKIKNFNKITFVIVFFGFLSVNCFAQDGQVIINQDKNISNF